MNAFPLYLSYFELLQPLPLDLIVVENLKNVQCIWLSVNT